MEKIVNSNVLVIITDSVIQWMENVFVLLGLKESNVTKRVVLEHLEKIVPINVNVKTALRVRPKRDSVIVRKVGQDNSVIDLVVKNIMVKIVENNANA